MSDFAGRGTVPLRTASSVLGVDVQTLRVMIRFGAVDFGTAWQRPGARRWQYIIWAEPFRALTGYASHESKEGEAQ